MDFSTYSSTGDPLSMDFYQYSHASPKNEIF